MAEHLSVAIATAGRPKLLERTLRSLSECGLPATYEKTLIIENGLQCGVSEIVAGFDPSLKFKYLYRSEPNKSAALNLALDQLDNETLVVFFDDDVRFKPDVLTTYERVSAGKNCGEFYGGPFGVDYEITPAAWLKPYLPRSARGWQIGEDAFSNPDMTFLGCNWAAFVADLRMLKGFDTSLGPGRTRALGQEVEMQRRLLEQGVRRCPNPDACVWHYVPRERSSKIWVLRKGFDGAKAKAIRDFTSQPPMPSVAGYPKYLVRIWLAHVASYLMSIFRAEPDRFRKKYRVWQTSGELVGARGCRRMKDECIEMDPRLNEGSSHSSSSKT